MQEIPPVRQSITFRNALQVGVSGMVLSLLIVALATPPRASALSLSLDAGVQLPLLPQLDVTASISTLNAPLHAQIGASVSPPTPTAQPKPPPLVGVGVSIPPAISAPTVAASPTSAGEPITVSPTPATAEGVSTVAAQKALPKKPNIATSKAATTAHIASNRRTFLGLDLPNGLSFMPQAIAGNEGDFRVAIAILTGTAVLLLGLATFTTARLARGSPQKV